MQLHHINSHLFGPLNQVKTAERKKRMRILHESTRRKNKKKILSIEFDDFVSMPTTKEFEGSSRMSIHKGR